MAKEIGTYKSVRGPYSTKNGFYRVQIVLWDKSVRQKTFKDENKAKEFVKEASVKIIETAAIKGETLEIPEYRNDLSWFRESLSVITYNMIVTDSYRMIDMVKAVATAASAFKGMSDQTEMEEQLTKLTRKIQDIQSARAHGTRSTWANQGSPSVAPALAINE